MLLLRSGSGFLMKRKPERPTAVQLERLDARVRELHQQALKAGHLVLRQGSSLECARCGASGTVHCSTEVPGGLQFFGDIFGEAPEQGTALNVVGVIPKCDVS